jgi:hypothetical protein
MKGTGANLMLLALPPVRRAVWGPWDASCARADASLAKRFWIRIRRVSRGLPCPAPPSWPASPLPQIAAFVEAGGASDKLKHFYEGVRDARRTVNPVDLGGGRGTVASLKPMTPEAAQAVLDAAGEGLWRWRVPRRTGAPGRRFAHLLVLFLACIGRTCALGGRRASAPRGTGACSPDLGWLHGAQGSWHGARLPPAAGRSSAPPPPAAPCLLHAWIFCVGLRAPGACAVETRRELMTPLCVGERKVGFACFGRQSHTSTRCVP